MNSLKLKCDSVANMIELGKKIGCNLRGGEIFVLNSDLGGGKTTFVTGLVKGFGSQDHVASPSYTISYVYSRTDGKTFHHYDFYRLDEPGIMADEINEVLADGDQSVIAVEWSGIITDILPKDKVVTIEIKIETDESRHIEISYPESYQYLFEEIKT